jgi:class II lanthipeptide synthase
MTDYRRLVAAAAGAVDVLSASSFAWFGARSPSLSPEVEAQMTPEGARAYLVYNLQARLYADFYCARIKRPSLQDPSVEPFPGSSPFVSELSRANAGTGASEPGWRVGEDSTTLAVRRNGLTLWVARADVYPVAGTSTAPGADVGVLMPNELLRLSPGFYMALGNAEFPVDGSAPIVRFYWNLRSDGAAGLIAGLTRDLNREKLAFRLKVVSAPGRYSRCDAGVLYVLEDEYDRASRVVANNYRTMAALVKPAPALTKELAPGLALAEDPGGQLTSFGMSRAQLLAEAIALAANRGASEPAEKLSAIEDRFAQAGISLDAPYLNPGSIDEYRFSAQCSRCTRCWTTGRS